jgi:hypothetical protein
MSANTLYLYALDILKCLILEVFMVTVPIN